MPTRRTNRREFIAGLGGAAAWTTVASAQRSAVPTIGFLGISSLEKMGGGVLLDFKRGLANAGFVEGQNVTIEYRWAEEQYDRLPSLAMELVQRGVTVLAAPGSPAALPAKAATRDIPIVFMIGSDPVKLGLVASLNRPGGNLTGVSYFNEEVAPKRLELLHEFVPEAKSVALLVNPANSTLAATQIEELKPAADAMGLHLDIVKASNAVDLEQAFAIMAREQIEALQLGVDPLFGNHIDQIVSLAQHNKIPAVYPWREFTMAGGLMNYGSSIPDAYQQVGMYVGQILKGAKPAELPVQRPTKLILVVNTKAAKALGASFPAPLLARADEVIE
jgi:putative tryptophan/tyrosine transport system substrate-binding protein